MITTGVWEVVVLWRRDAMTPKEAMDAYRMHPEAMKIYAFTASWRDDSQGGKEAMDFSKIFLRHVEAILVWPKLAVANVIDRHKEYSEYLL